MKILGAFVKRNISILLMASSLGVLPGCAAIQHRELSVQAKMSDTIFLNPETLESGKPIYVRVTNTSDFQEINFGEMLKNKIQASGRKVTVSPKEAAYLIQANLLYLGEEKKDYTYEGALAGGFGGALGTAIATRHSSFGTQSLASAGVGLAAAGVGALVGSMVHVDDYIGLVDVQIKEAVEGGVRGVETASLKQGSGNTVQTERSIQDSRQEYRTRIGVKATQTNIDRTAAANAIAERLAAQIAGYFK